MQETKPFTFTWREANNVLFCNKRIDFSKFLLALGTSDSSWNMCVIFAFYFSVKILKSPHTYLTFKLFYSYNPANIWATLALSCQKAEKGKDSI